MTAHGFTDPAQLQLYFEARVAAMFRADKRTVIWEENSGKNSSYPHNAIVQVWKGRAGDLSVLEPLIRDGYKTLYTTVDWYFMFPNICVFVY